MKAIEYNALTGEVTQREMTAEEIAAMEIAAMEAIQQPQNSYDQLVSDLIRAKYTIDQEIAINRQRDTKPEEFQEYFDFCEQCKIKAREQIL